MTSGYRHAIAGPAPARRASARKSSEKKNERKKKTTNREWTRSPEIYQSHSLGIFCAAAFTCRAAACFRRVGTRSPERGRRVGGKGRKVAKLVSHSEESIVRSDLAETLLRPKGASEGDQHQQHPGSTATRPVPSFSFHPRASRRAFRLDRLCCSFTWTAPRNHCPDPPKSATRSLPPRCGISDLPASTVRSG